MSTTVKIDQENTTINSVTPSTNHSFTWLFGQTMPFDVITATYAIMVATGGIMGYVSKRSVPSLVAGLAFGGFFGLGSYLETAYDHHWFTVGTSGLLGAIMTDRWIKGGRFMPAGLISVLSIGTALRQSIILYQIYREKHANQPTRN